MQQDAEECWTNILASLRSKLVVGGGPGPLMHGPSGIGCNMAMRRWLFGGCRPAAGWLSRRPAARPTCTPAQMPLPPAWPPPQEGPEGSGDPVIRKLFGVKLHTSLKAEEGDEAIEVGHASQRARKPEAAASLSQLPAGGVGSWRVLFRPYFKQARWTRSPCCRRTTRRASWCATSAWRSTT